MMTIPMNRWNSILQKAANTALILRPLEKGGTGDLSQASLFLIPTLPNITNTVLLNFNTSRNTGVTYR